MKLDLSKIAYVVPNIPRFTVDVQKTWEWWDEVSVPIKRLRVDSRGHSRGYEGEFWNGVTIWQKPTYQDNIVWKVNYHPNADLFDNLVSDILQALPWYDVVGVTLWSHKTSIPPHRDGLPIEPFPCAPRIGLIDECDRRTFYLIDKKQFKLFRPDVQEGPNLFFFNNQNFEHGASEAKNGRKILVRIDGPIIDADGLNAFINSQIENGARYEGISQ